MGMLCNRRGGCFAAGCFKWGCPTGPCSPCPTSGCCGGGGSPPNIFNMMLDPCYKKQLRNSMQIVYGAYYGGWCPPCGMPSKSFQNGCFNPPCLPNCNPPPEPIRIVFKCPTYCTPLPEPVMTC